MTLDVEAARQAIERAIAHPLGLSLETAAHGILQIANANMSRAIRSVSVEKGYDLGQFALCAFGGAGPLHAAEVALECAIPVILVPREPGTLCARGMLLTDLSSDYIQSCFAPATPQSWADTLVIIARLTAEAEAWFARDKVPANRRRFKAGVDARYRGQNFEIKVDCSGLGAADFDRVIERFHAAHTLEYGYEIRHRAVDFVSARLQAIGTVEKAPQDEIAGGGSLQEAKQGARPVYIDAQRGWVETGVYWRAKLPVGCRLDGPAIITEMSATTLLLPGQWARVDKFGNLILGNAS
jgi:N-methylhydantoinase A